MKDLKYLGTLLKILFKVDKRFLVTTVIETVVFAVLPFVQLYLTKQSVTMLTSGETYRNYMIIVGIVIAVLFVLGIVSVKLNTHNNIKGNLIGQKMYENIFEKCLYMDFEKLQMKEIQDKKEMATKAFASGALAMLIMYFKTIVGNAIIIAGTVGVVFFADWKLMILALVIVAVNGMQLVKAKKIQYNSDKEMAPINRKLEYFVGISSDFSVAKEVRLFGFAQKLLDEYRILYKKTFEILKKVFAANRKNQEMACTTSNILEVAIYFLLGYRLLVTQDMNIAEFSTYALAIRTFSGAMNQVIDSCGEIEKNAMHLRDYFEFLDIKSIFTGKKGKTVSAPEYELRLDNVSFKYPGNDDYALKNINLSIYPGEKLSVVGENGSGKTTLVKLIMRLYDPTEGNIYLNGINIKEIDYEQYLKLFSAVFQDFKVYAFTIAQNINLFSEESVDREKALLGEVGLLNKVESLKHGLDTYLFRIYDDEGVELSGGQNQKLAIARAIYKDAPIVIMDEPTAALDPRAESEIFADFGRMVNGKTAIYISHRMSNCLISDHIVVLDKGNLIEYGTHKELMEKGGRYNELFNMQAKYYVGEVS
ncbi:MAG: ABC transporter ATP-binding protein/permease [Lachnospiraceae bacterium]|nr:ABC transporter ATP-binding protein/permease [Lachnospiraceae bacterium]